MMLQKTPTAPCRLLRTMLVNLLQIHNNPKVLLDSRGLERASPVSLQCSCCSLLAVKTISYKASTEPSRCFLLPPNLAGKGRGEHGSRASLGNKPENQVDGRKMLPLGVKATFAPSGGLQPS